MTETPIEQRIYNGDRAREVLDNEAFQWAFEETEKEILQKWMDSPARDAEGREKLWQYLTLLKKVRTHLQTTLETGKLARLDLQHKQTLAERVSGIWSTGN